MLEMGIYLGCSGPANEKVIGRGNKGEPVESWRKGKRQPVQGP